MKKADRPRRVEWGHLDIFLHQYRLTVVVAWAMSKAALMALARRHKIAITNEQWGKDWDVVHDDVRAQGFCMEFGDDNADLLVWLRKRPRTAWDYGTLYHELYHAVQAVIRSRAMTGERESPAFLYEYLATKCNQRLWT